MYLFTNPAVFFNFVQNAFDPPPHFEHLKDFFVMDWEALCTAIRLDNIRHRFE